MVQHSRITHTEDGNATIGSGERHGDGDGDDAESEISLLPLSDKGIHAEGLFLNLDCPRHSFTVTAETVAGRARFRWPGILQRPFRLESAG